MQNITDRSDLSSSTLHSDPHKFEIIPGEYEEDNYLDALKEENFTNLLLKRGRIFSTTRLRNIQYSVSSLEHFAAVFTNDINRKIGVDPDCKTYQVDLKRIDSNVQHPCPLKIGVKKLSENERETGFVYVGVFYSWRTSEMQSCGEYLNLSFLFAAASQKFVDIMNSIFQKYFDCKITPIIYTQIEMKWLLAVMTECVKEKSPINVQLTYETNNDNLKAEFKCPLAGLQEIWHDIHDKNRNVIKLEEVVRLFAAVDEHILESSGLDLSLYLLKRFSIPQYITLDSDGKIHIADVLVLDLVCRFINDHLLD